MSIQKITLEGLQNHQADMEQLSKSLELKNQTQIETHVVAVEKLKKQLTSRKKTFNEVLWTRAEFQRKFHASESRASNLQATVDTGLAFRKLAETKIETLEASLRLEKKIAADAFAEISQLKFTLKEQVSEITNLKSIISKYDIRDGELDSVAITSKEKEDLNFLLKQIAIADSDKDADATSLRLKRRGEDNAKTGNKNMVVDNDVKFSFLKTDFNKIYGVKDLESQIVHRKHSLNSDMSITEDVSPKLSSAMSFTDDNCN